MHVIVLTFNRLHLGFLGCYGNSWVETPHFDRLAARSVVGDRHYAHSTELADNQAGWWEPGLFETLAQHRVSVRQMAEAGSLDGATASRSRDAAGWETIRGADGVGLEHQETPFARLVDALIGSVQVLMGNTAADGAWLVWGHSAGVPELWIPPEPFASLYFDEVFDTEEAEDSAQVPREELLQAVDQLLHALHAADAPPDLAMQLEDSDWQLLRAVYAGYVTLLDFQLGRLLDALHAAGLPLLLVVTAANGTALGEQRIRGQRRAPFPEELMHVPLFVTRFGDQGGEAWESCRYSGFTQPSDVCATLLDAFGVVPGVVAGDGRSLLPLAAHRGEIAAREEVVFREATGDRGLLNRHYAYHRSASEDNTGAPHLYLQPEDIWHVNDVAEQNPETILGLEQRLMRLQ